MSENRVYPPVVAFSKGENHGHPMDLGVHYVQTKPVASEISPRGRDYKDPILKNFKHQKWQTKVSNVGIWCYLRLLILTILTVSINDTVCKFIELPSIQKMNWLVWIPYCQGKETMRLMREKGLVFGNDLTKKRTHMHTSCIHAQHMSLCICMLNH